MALTQSVNHFRFRAKSGRADSPGAGRRRANVNTGLSTKFGQIRIRDASAASSPPPSEDDIERMCDTGEGKPNSEPRPWLSGKRTAHAQHQEYAGTESRQQRARRNAATRPVVQDRDQQCFKDSDGDNNVDDRAVGKSFSHERA